MLFRPWLANPAESPCPDHLGEFPLSGLGAQRHTDLLRQRRRYVFLPWLLARLVGRIQPLIRKEGTLLFEKK